MKAILDLAAFVGIGAIITSAGTLGLKGADALTLVTIAVLNGGGVANAGTIVYVGTGSSAGEAAMVAGTQTIAPMSRVLGAATCAANPSYRQNAIGLDAICRQ
jgi:hypothetical protein